MVFDRRLLLAFGLSVGLLCCCLAGTVFGAGKAKKGEAAKFVPGEEIRIDVDDERIGNDHFIVYVPNDYTDERDWPVIFCYHGQSGQPTTWPMRQAVRGKGFIVIGMGYVPTKKKMTKREYINLLKREKRSVLEVKKYVGEHLKIDEKRLFVTGFSKGGWHSANMVEASPRGWAGAVIFAAGRRGLVQPTSKKAFRGKPIYIGAGENDVNMKAAKRAMAYYRRLGAKVTFEEFKDVGHSFDPSGSEILYNWLVSNSTTSDAEDEPTDKEVELKSKAGNQESKNNKP
jgi:predicted esterase